MFMEAPRRCSLRSHRASGRGLAKSGVRVITIKPGFVDTPMTAAFRKGPLWAKPEQVAKGIVNAIDGSNRDIYLPRFWRLIMFIIRSIPERVFVRLKL